jgi:trk system potassium uptake protein TrkA
VAAVHSLRRGAAEALELVAHGDAKSSQVVGRRVEEIDLPKGTTIGAIVRQRNQIAGTQGDTTQEAQVIIAHHDTMIEAEDHVIIFVVNKRMVPRVEKLFQVSAGFF